MITEIELDEFEKRQFKNIKKLEDIRNSLLDQVKQLDTNVKDYREKLVARLNHKYGIMTDQDYVYDEPNDRVIHCLAHEAYLNSNIVTLKVHDEFSRVVEGYFQSLLNKLSEEYTILKNSKI